MSSENPFDPKKVNEAAKKFSDELHDRIHRDIHERVTSWDEKQQARRRPLVVGIDLRGRGRGGMVMGAILMVVGLLFLLDHLGYISIGNPFRFWPLLLVFAGIGKFLTRGQHLWGFLFLTAGVILQLNELGITHFGWGAFWPMMLIAVGIVVLWGSMGWSNKPPASSSTTPDPRTTLNEAVVFGGLEKRITSQDFQGGDVTAIFGGAELDLTEANIQADQATLAITVIFGGAEIRIPPNWQVAFRGAPIFGGIEDKTRTARLNDPSHPDIKVLVITGAVIFGGLEIKN